MAALVAFACGKKQDNSTGAAAPSATAASAGPRTVEITANDQMKFSVTHIDAKAGEQLTVVLTNTGTQPVEVMGHNWTLLKKGSDVAAFDLAASKEKQSDYFPESLAGEVIAHTKLLGPRKSDQVTFTVPSEPGDYPFLCTFPAHYQVGMKGELTVK
ncbi:MAG TPA: azurin [Opitutus sp.]|nr:azurin [Opitutus sp.]